MTHDQHLALKDVTSCHKKHLFITIEFYLKLI